MVAAPEGKRRVSFRRDSVGKAICVPCGNCTGCVLERSRQWTVRLINENSLHDDSCFLTLTFDDDHLPMVGSVRLKKDVSTLDVPTCQKFLKRLRKAIWKQYRKKIRFFLAAEYGEDFGRPHYHAIIFGFSFPDKVRVRDGSSTGSGLFASRLLDSVWGQGFTSIGDVTPESAAYVAGYCLKKIKGRAADEHYSGRVPEFVLMSRNPGIGARWYEKFSKDVYPSDEVIVRGKSVRAPRYYDKKFALDDPEMFESIRLKREARAMDLVPVHVGNGEFVEVDKNLDPRRLGVRRRIAEARLRLKSRTLR